jgi:hypothetical protein
VSEWVSACVYIMCVCVCVCVCMCVYIHIYTYTSSIDKYNNDVGKRFMK